MAQTTHFSSLASCHHSTVMTALPLLGFGTMSPAQEPSDDHLDLKSAILKALDCGYRHLDSAEEYDSAPVLKEALRETSVPREQIFITSKLKGLPCGDYSAVQQRTKKILEDLGLAQLDLLLIHWPGEQTLDLSGSPEKIQELASRALFEEKLPSAWENMLRLQKEGLTRHIGVSNFYSYHLETLTRIFPEDSQKPFANEIFIDLLHRESELVASLQQRGIRVIAYRPVAFVPVYSFLEDVSQPLEALVSSTSAASTQQLALALLMKQGIHVIPQSTNPARIQENFSAVELSSRLSADHEGQVSSLANSTEMIDMYGGCDEYAMGFKSL